MSFDKNGYTKETLEEVMSRLINNTVDLIPNATIDPSNWIYQVIKLNALETMHQQLLIEAAVSNMTLLGADGIFIDYFANDSGLFRKGADYATGTVQFYFMLPSSQVIISKDLKLTSTEGKDYYTSEELIVDDKIYFKYDGTSKQILSSNVHTFTPDASESGGVYTGGIYELSDTEITTVQYEVDGNVVTWVDTTGMTTNGYYYLKVDKNQEFVVNVSVVAAEKGSEYNTGPNTITQIAAPLSGLIKVSNELSLINGSDEETDSELKTRIINARRKQFTLERIRDIVEQHNGVKHAIVFQNTSSDIVSVSDWTTIPDPPPEVTFGSADDYITITFHPSDGIGTIKDLVVRAKQSGNAPPMLKYYLTFHTDGDFVFRNEESSFLISGSIGNEAFISGTETTWQDIRIPINYTGLDKVDTYRIYLYVEDISDGNWHFATTDNATMYGNWREKSTYYNGSEVDLPTTVSNPTMIFKTMYGTPGYTISIIPRDGFDFQLEIKGDIDALVGDTEQGGYSPVCIEKTVVEAQALNLTVSGRLSIMDNYTFTDVVDAINNSIVAYLDTLSPGDPIIYSQLERAILLTDGVLRIRKLMLTLDYGTYTRSSSIDNEIDLGVAKTQYVILDSLNLTEDY